MAMNQSNTSSWILSLKIALISTGVLSMAAALRISVPVVADFVFSEIPSLWSFLLSWLKPPYLYVLINFIIIGIVASSKLHHHKASAEEDPPFPASEKICAEDGGVVLSGFGYDDAEVAAKAVEAEAAVEAPAVEVVGEVVEDSSSMTWNSLPRKDSVESALNEVSRPPISARFGNRKAVKSSPEGGKSLRVSKPKKQDTLETTWKTITEGRAMPLARHLKKSDTWESHLKRQPNDENTPPPMKKSETFSERASVKIKREPSLGQDELNRRVEAFINKFNHEMRLQRMESLNHYHDMVRRGAH